MRILMHKAPITEVKAQVHAIEETDDIIQFRRSRLIFSPVSIPSMF
jgi:hypothetical protein